MTRLSELKVERAELTARIQELLDEIVMTPTHTEAHDKLWERVHLLEARRGKNWMDQHELQ